MCIRDRINADWFNAKAKISVKLENQKIPSFSSLIISENDKRLWLNAKSFGFEAGRILLTQDSIMVMNRLQKQYIKERIDNVSEGVELPSELFKELGVSQLQDALIGNPLNSTIPYTVLTIKEDAYVLTGEMEGVQSTLILNKVTQLPRSASFETQNSTVTIDYNDYRLLGEKQFSYQRKISLTSSDRISSLDIQYSSVELDSPKKINFSIPPSYEKMQF